MKYTANDWRKEVIMKGLISSQTDEDTLPHEISSFGLSHQGYVRSKNEDAWGSLPKERFYVLADGMGGRNGGEIASNEAVKILCELIKKDPSFIDAHTSFKDVKKALISAIKKTNEEVWNIGKVQADLEGMGTTLSCLCLLKNCCVIANIGDSRIYRWRLKTLEQLTQDDSLLADLIKFDLVDDNEAKTFPLKHVITKSLGTMPQIEPSLGLIEVERGDIFLLCTDGLTNFVEEKSIQSIIEKMETIEKGANSLIHAALDAGGHDNITVVLVKIA